ncbi:MAG: hypothetical protein HY658_10980 [Actinobacteria bacterium]|nr:hypothetical protein [Actinomycetota bacterium]
MAWSVTWAQNRREKLTLGLAVSPAERLRWLEEMIELAHRTGALPRKEPRRLGDPRH